ncbi:MAG: diacylglycerol kinase [Candidatus Pacebacteria bacterium]|nr:diacylglycerol kinase [Candidatus Paceibacterota bacterium]
MEALFSFSKLSQSIKIALLGIKNAFKKEQTFRFELIYGIVTIILSFLFALNSIEFSIILICIGVTLGFELLNSQIEKTVDILKPEFNQQARIIKDMSAAAVLMVVIVSIIVGILIFLPHFLKLFG